MEQRAFRFIDLTGLGEAPLKLTDPVVISKEDLEAETDRLAGLPVPENGRRVSLIANPATGIGNGLAHGIAVSLCVLRPGEQTRPIRHNSSQVNFCIRGAGHTIVGGKRIDFAQYDVWNTPPWAVYQHVNDTKELQVRLTYSNSALLEKLNIHLVDESPAAAAEALAPPREHPDRKEALNPFGTFELGDTGAFLMPYEKLINPDVVRVEALHWPWQRVKQELDKLTVLGPSYVGRRLYLLYHPATGRTNGTTQNFFVAITVRPANIVDRPHRHIAAAINYFFAGSGYSVVEGKTYHWKAGDLMLTAPGWAIHNHAALNEDVYEMTVQDSPLNIAMGSLLWQEDLRRSPEALGVSAGFETNRAAQQVG